MSSDETENEHTPTCGVQFPERNPTIGLGDSCSDTNHCYRGKTAAPSPDKRLRQSGREKQKANQAERECENGLRQQKGKAEPINVWPLVDGATPQDHRDPSESGNRHGDLGGVPECLSGFHRIPPSAMTMAASIRTVDLATGRGPLGLGNVG